MLIAVDEAIARQAWEPPFLALCIWREARGASLEAKIAVGYSIMNRVERPSWWGRSLSGILGKKFQYSSLTAPNDPQLTLYPHPEDPFFQESLEVARAVIARTEPIQFPGADSYHDSSVETPKAMATGRLCGEIVSPHGNTLQFWDVDHDYEAPVTGHV